MNIWKTLFLSKSFFIALIIIIFGFFLGFFFPVLFQISKLLLTALILLTIIDLVLLLSSKSGIKGFRELKDKLSNFDKNPVRIHFKNLFPFQIKYEILDEVPMQFQLFDFSIKGKLNASNEVDLQYDLIPKERGMYQFGNTNVFVQSPLRILQRKIILKTEIEIKVYPSFLRLNQYDIKNFKVHLNEIGQRKVRRIGHSMEFEQIKNYVSGDDIRTINWKSTAKHKKLMVNQYVDEKSQQVYCVIDKGRIMKMPFKGMTLLDYSVNACLVFSNVVLQNHDRAGIFTFSSKLENLVKAERRTNQIQKISEGLYNVHSDFMESDFGKLYNSIKYKITQRGLILLFTNFENMDSLKRQLPYLLGINKSQLLVVVFFKNTELDTFLKNNSGNKDVYEKTLVEKFVYEKQQIVLELNKHGIQTILTHPEDLTINTINKYLEIKSRGMI